MSASNEWTEWHLTPRGWEEGTGKRDFGHHTEGMTPPDRILTCRYTEYLGSMGAEWERSTTEMWRSSDSAAVAELLKKYGPCPERV